MGWGVLPCVVMMTLSCDDVPSNSFGYKSFSISEDLVETIVALTLNITK